MMRKTFILWIGMLCALTGMTYRAEARTTAMDQPQQPNGGGFISGRVITTDAARPEEMSITALILDGRVVGSYHYSPYTPGNAYRLGPLEPGSYRLKTRIVTTYNEFVSHPTDGWYDHASMEVTSTVVEVTAGMTTTADFDMTTFGEISGAVDVQQTRRSAEDMTMLYARNELDECRRWPISLQVSRSWHLYNLVPRRRRAGRLGVPTQDV